MNRTIHKLKAFQRRRSWGTRETVQQVLNIFCNAAPVSSSSHFSPHESSCISQQACRNHNIYHSVCILASVNSPASVWSPWQHAFRLMSDVRPLNVNHIIRSLGTMRLVNVIVAKDPCPESTRLIWQEFIFVITCQFIKHYWLWIIPVQHT